MSHATFSSPKIARAFSQQLNTKLESVKVEMKYTKEVGSFIKKVETAQKKSANSKLIFR